MFPMPARLSLACAVGLLAAASPAQDWPNWRGPNWNGSATVAGLPAEFGPEKNCRWSLDLPGPGASTPIVVGDRVFLTAVDAERERLVALCVDAADGSVHWSRDADSEFAAGLGESRIRRGNRSNYASPSAVCDGERVVFFFGNGDLVAYDLEGEELWRRNVQEDHGVFAFQWTFSATPTMFEGRLYLPVLQRDVPTGNRGFGRRGGGRRGRGPDGGEAGGDAAPEPIESFLLCYDPATGEELWRHVRPTDARMESRESYATIVPHRLADGGAELIVFGGDVVTGHDPEAGAERWRWGTWNEGHREQWWRVVPSPVVAGDVVVVCAPKREPAFAVKLGGEGVLGEAGLAWQSEGRANPVSSDVPTPAFDGEHLYVLSDVRKAMSKVAAGSGEVVWTVDMPGPYLWRGSPTVVGDRIYCINHNGELVVMSTKDGAILHSARFCDGEEDFLVRASIVAARGSLFVRTHERLYCIGG